VEVIYAWVDDLVHALVHVILGKVTSKMLTSYLKIGPISWMDHKSCSDLCDLRLGEKLIVNMCFTSLYSFIDPLSIFNVVL
jgi:hypothetical protein